MLFFTLQASRSHFHSFVFRILACSSTKSSLLCFPNKLDKTQILFYSSIFFAFPKNFCSISFLKKERSNRIIIVSIKKAKSEGEEQQKKKPQHQYFGNKPEWTTLMYFNKSTIFTKLRTYMKTR